VAACDPFDRIHFHEFIAVLHHTGHRLDPTDLKAWLLEQDVPLKLARELEQEFDRHLQLLSIYDKLRNATDPCPSVFIRPPRQSVFATAGG